MTKIQIFIINQVDQKPWLELDVQALPRKGDDFEMEKGRLYKVDSVRFVPQKTGDCAIQVWLLNPSEFGVQES